MRKLTPPRSRGFHSRRQARRVSGDAEFSDVVTRGVVQRTVTVVTLSGGFGAVGDLEILADRLGTGERQAERLAALHGGILEIEQRGVGGDGAALKPL